MNTSTVDRKKRTELIYLEDARRACNIFPSGPLAPGEAPDFVLSADRCIGIEVTELCRQEERREGGRLEKIVERAKTRYSQLPGAPPVDVSASFSIDAPAMPARELIDTLVQHVKVGSLSSQLPKGYCHVAVHPPLRDPNGTWRSYAAFDTVVAPKELLSLRIAEKNDRVAAYRLNGLSEVWLLIVNDLFLGAGEVYVRPEDLATWTFEFAFDRVLVFTREVGGTGVVLEVRHT
jgi:hypothetical protein